VRAPLGRPEPGLIPPRGMVYDYSDFGFAFSKSAERPWCHQCANDMRSFRRLDMRSRKCFSGSPYRGLLSPQTPSQGPRNSPRIYPLSAPPGPRFRGGPTESTILEPFACRLLLTLGTAKIIVLLTKAHCRVGGLRENQGPGTGTANGRRS
jgi:hypothetical protein